MMQEFLNAASRYVSTDVEARYLEGARYEPGQSPAILRPSTSEDVIQLLRLASQCDVRLVVQGAHTSLVEAATPRGEIVLSTERLRHVFQVEELDKTLRVSAGFRLSEINARLERDDLVFPIDLGADPSVGGMLAHNTGGARMLRYGDVRANVLALDVVLASGRQLRLGRGLCKDNSQLHFQGLFVGSSGGLGVITEATLKLHARPKQRTVALVAVASLENVWPLYRKWSRTFGDLISAFEGISANALGAALRCSRTASPFAEIPEYSLLVELSTAMPAKCVDARAVLHAELEAALDSGELTDAVVNNDDALWALRHSISEGLRAFGPVIGFDISLPRANLWDFRSRVSSWLSADYPDAIVCDFGHLGDGGQHFNLVWPSDAVRLAGAEIEVLKGRFYALLAEFGGCFSAEHGLGPRVQDAYDRYTPTEVREVTRQVVRSLGAEERLGRFRF